MTDYKKKYIKYKLKYLHLVGGEPINSLGNQRQSNVPTLIEIYENLSNKSQQSTPKKSSTQQKSLNPSQALTKQNTLSPSQASQQEIIDLKKCSKLEFFKKNKKLQDGEYFDSSYNFQDKIEELKKFDQKKPECFQVFIELITNQKIYNDLSVEEKKNLHY